MHDSESALDSSSTGEPEGTSASGAPSEVDQPDGGPGSHNEGGTGGADNDPASGGVSEDEEQDQSPSP